MLVLYILASKPDLVLSPFYVLRGKTVLNGYKERIYVPLIITAGNIDSSGLRLTLTRTPRQFNAGIIGIGAEVNSNLFVPPNVNQFDIYGYCPGSCTRQVSSNLH